MGAIKINGSTSGSTTITAPDTGGDESIELSTALASKLDASVFSSTGTWTAYTPTFSGGSWAVGNGSFSSDTRYIQIGKLVIFNGAFVFGSTTVKDASNALGISLPVTAKSTSEAVGSASFLDSGTANYAGMARLATTTVLSLQELSVTGTKITHGGLTTNSPFTWATNDTIRWTIVYEAA